MDKVLSTRVDESVISRIGMLAQHLKTSKKRIIEDAVAAFDKQIDREKGVDVWEQTCGAWRRGESSSETVNNVRRAFRESMVRYQ